jgi:hypothetical protein
MPSEWTLCRCGPAWTVVGLYLLAVAASTGCSLPKTQGSMGTLATAKQFNEVSITYRTESDRVNLAAAGHSGPTQMVSFQQPSPGLLPNVTTTTLHIQHPHPDGIPGYARARVVVRANGAEASKGSSIWGRLTGGSDDQGAGSHNAQIIEAWLLDIPAWQVNGIMTKLQEENFFRRAKVLGADTFLAVKADGAGFGKKYRSLPELDALILRARHEGRPLGRPPYGPIHPTYGPTQPAYGAAQPVYAPTQPPHGPAQPTYGASARLNALSRTR